MEGKEDKDKQLVWYVIYIYIYMYIYIYIIIIIIIIFFFVYFLHIRSLLKCYIECVTTRWRL